MAPVEIDIFDNHRNSPRTITVKPGAYYATELLGSQVIVFCDKRDERGGLRIKNPSGKLEVVKYNKTYDIEVGKLPPTLSIIFCGQTEIGLGSGLNQPSMLIRHNGQTNTFRKNP